jgi:hypothetical protein
VGHDLINSNICREDPHAVRAKLAMVNMDRVVASESRCGSCAPCCHSMNHGVAGK